MSEKKIKVTYGGSVDPDHVEILCEGDTITINVGVNRKEVLFDIVNDSLEIIGRENLVSDREDVVVKELPDMTDVMHDMFELVMKQRIMNERVLMMFAVAVILFAVTNGIRYWLDGSYAWAIVNAVLVVMNGVVVYSAARRIREVKTLKKGELCAYEACKAEALKL